MFSFNGRRRGLLAAASLGALLVAAPSAGAASIGGGTADVNLKRSFTRAAGNIAPVFPATRDGRRGVSLPIAVNGGTVTLTARPTGTINAERRAGFELKRRKREATFDNCTVAMTGKRARLRCDGLTIMQGSLKGDRIEPDAAFTTLEGRVPLNLTRAGARFLNRKLKPNRRLKGGRSAGSMSLEAERLLTVISGSSRTYYDPTFYDQLQSCGIDLLPIAPAVGLPAGPEAPRGGVDLPQRAAGTLNAVTHQGTVEHDGGTQLNRPASHPSGSYVSDLLNYVFSLGSTANLLADVPKLNLQRFNIGSVQGGTFTQSLTDTGGSVTFSGAELVLSQLASGTLAGETGCNIPSGAKIGTVEALSNVE